MMAYYVVLLFTPTALAYYSIRHFVVYIIDSPVAVNLLFDIVWQSRLFCVS